MEAYLSRSGFISDPEGSGSSDHVAFERAGIPSVVLGTLDTGLIHTANDTVQNIDMDMLRGIAGMIVDFITENQDIHTALEDNHAVNAALADEPTLAYNEAVLQDDTLYKGSCRWITHAEALRYHPSLPLPQVYKGCPIEACMVVLSTFDMPDSAPGQIVTLPDDPQNITQITALYSNGITSYRFDFHVYKVSDPYVKKKIGEDGYLLSMRESDIDVKMGIGLVQDDMSLYLFDSDASDLSEVETGLSVHLNLYDTSKVTDENASTLLKDPELTGLFQALRDFVQP
jgi:hypothetical protein